MMPSSGNVQPLPPQRYTTSEDQFINNLLFSRVSQSSTHHSGSRLSPNTSAISNGTRKSASSTTSAARDYRNLRSKPPLPEAAHQSHHRIYSPRNSRQSITWSSNSITPRMRSSSEVIYPGGHNRPVSPITRGFLGGGGAAVTSSLDNKNVSPKFRYSGPNQFYVGPTTGLLSAETPPPAPLNWTPTSKYNNDNLVAPPPLPSLNSLKEIGLRVLHNRQASSSTSPVSPPQQSPIITRTKTEEEFLLNVLHGGRRTEQISPFESRHSALQLASPSQTPQESKTPSFPSSSALHQLEQASLTTPPSRPSNAQGQFSNSGIPNNIHDDLLKTETLIEFMVGKAS